MQANQASKRNFGISQMTCRKSLSDYSMQTFCQINILGSNNKKMIWRQNISQTSMLESSRLSTVTHSMITPCSITYTYNILHVSVCLLCLHTGNHWHNQIVRMLMEGTTEYTGFFGDDYVDGLPAEKMPPADKPRLLASHLRY